MEDSSANSIRYLTNSKENQNTKCIDSLRKIFSRRYPEWNEIMNVYLYQLCESLTTVPKRMRSTQSSPEIKLHESRPDGYRMVI